MRNLKRTLSLVLCLAMVAAFWVVPAFAAGTASIEGTDATAGTTLTAGYVTSSGASADTYKWVVLNQATATAGELNSAVAAGTNASFVIPDSIGDYVFLVVTDTDGDAVRVLTGHGPIVANPGTALVAAAKSAIDGATIPTLDVPVGATNTEKETKVAGYLNALVTNVTLTVTTANGTDFNVVITSGTVSDTTSVTVAFNEVATVYVPVDATKTKFAKTDAELNDTTHAPAAPFAQTLPAGWNGIEFNLTAGKLEIPAGAAGIAAYNTAGKWVKYDEAKFLKAMATLLKKGGTLMITDKTVDDKGKALDNGKKAVGAYTDAKGEAVDAVDGVASSYTLAFAKIEAAPSKLKVVPNYTEYADNDFTTAGNWTISEKGKPDEYGKIDYVEYLRPADKKKPAEGEAYAAFPDGGVAIQALGDNDKVGGKNTYYIRQIAYVDTTGTAPKYIPASPASKLGVAAQQKAPNLKPDYKKGIIKPKAGVAIKGITPMNSEKDVAGGTADETTYVFYAKSATAAGKVPCYNAIAKEKMPEFAPAAATYAITVYTYASAKKPASVVQTINIAPAAPAPAAGVITWDGKKLALDGTVEAKAKITDAKWGKLPKLTPADNKTDTVVIRVKSTAKAVKGDPGVMGFDGAAASDVTTVTIAWGVKDAEGKYAPTIS
ncbi:MAG: hypothetical protein LBH95_04785 [Oscillospiraceae bacterium]|jgi:hypothetical protein|nr:hypothetical protein [Oscillospiraceae bacterium]